MSKTVRQRVPKEWWETKKKLADKLGKSTSEVIKLTDGVFAELVKKKVKRGTKLEITFK